LELIKVTVDGFKRFKERTHMYVGGKLIAIVGANEAGKSSFLKALVHINNTEEFIASGGNQELSRNVDMVSDKEIITYHFYLSKDDKEALSNIIEAKKVSKFLITKQVNGNLINSIGLEIKRDITSRKKILKLLDQANNNKKISERFLHNIEDINNDEENGELNIEQLGDLIEQINTDDETLGIDVLTMLEEAHKIFTKLIKEKDPKYIHELHSLLDFVIKNEKREVPNIEVINILSKKIPKIMLFDDSARNLKPEYNLEDENILKEHSLENLLITAEIDLSELKSEIQNENEGEVEEIIETGNTILKKKFKAWKQSTVYPRIKLDNYSLKVLIGEKDGKKNAYDDIAQRSDGLRQFMALFTFVNAKQSTNDNPKILLIDEAETHLHYDAQADFIQMLTNQDLVDKVIYTTHSMGCLPEDLGMGIRFVEQVIDEKKSRINNWFWKGSDGSEKIGFSNILFGMGAATLAFIPLRNSLISEGQVDFILLPSLFREAIEENILGFQIAPGLSNASVEQLIELDKESPKTVYITDSDHGMSKLHKSLEKANIGINRIFSLPKTKKNAGLAIEDIIIKSLYLKVLNEEIKKYNLDSNIELKLVDIPENDRANAVEEFCKKHRIHLPSKREVAFCLLEEKANGENILDKKYKTELSNIVSKIKAVFEEA